MTEMEPNSMILQLSSPPSCPTSQVNKIVNLKYRQEKPIITHIFCSSCCVYLCLFVCHGTITNPAWQSSEKSQHFTLTIEFANIYTTALQLMRRQLRQRFGQSNEQQIGQSIAPVEEVTVQVLATIV